MPAYRTPPELAVLVEADLVTGVVDASEPIDKAVESVVPDAVVALSAHDAAAMQTSRLSSGGDPARR